MLKIIKSLLMGGAKKITAGELAAKFGLELRGDADFVITGVAPIADAVAGQLAFYSTEKNGANAKVLPIDVLKKTRASVILLQPDMVKNAPRGRTLLITDRPRAFITQILGEMYSVKIPAKIAKSAVIHRGAFIGDNVVIGENTVVYPGAFIENTTIGDDCVIHNGASIGKDGFGYDPATGKFIPHIRGVVIGDRVSVGANTCIDRGVMADTIIGDDTKIDNLVQVAHGVVIGKNCFIAAQTGIAGGCVIGDRVFLGGQVGLANGVRIGNDAKVGAHSGIFRNIPDGESQMGYPAVPGMEFMRTHAWLRRAVKNN